MEKQSKPDALDRALTDLYRTDIPDGYRAAWRAAVQREEQTAMKPTPKRNPFLRAALPVAATLVLVIGALSAGRLIPATTPASAPVPAPKTAVVYDTAEYGSVSNRAVSFSAPAPDGAASNESFAADAGTGSASTADTADTASTAKIVRTADLTIATTAFDADRQALTDLTARLGGYIASVSVYGEASERMDRTAYYSLRIPSDQLDDFLTGVSAIGRITQRNETATDKTTQYNDTQMRLTTQQEKMTRLQALLKQASDVSDLLEIENEIANTQYTIDQLETSMRTIDRDVDNSAVSVTLVEQSAGDTAQATELTLWQRLQSGFEVSVKWLGTFLQNLLVFLSLILPVLVPLAVVGVPIGLAVRAHRRKRGAATRTPDSRDKSDSSDKPHHNNL